MFHQGSKVQDPQGWLSVDLPTFKENMKAAFWFEDIEIEIWADEAKDKGVQLGLNRVNSTPFYVQQQLPKRQKNPVGPQQKGNCNYRERAGHME